MIDDQIVAYTLIAQTYFEDLRQVAAQLAGQLVLDAAGALPDHPMRRSAEQVYRQAVDGLRSVRVPVRARVHYDHLLTAATKLNEALHGSGDPLIPLESAYAELRSASRALPGFQMISFERGCCAA
jgi:hypothetical protein